MGAERRGRIEDPVGRAADPFPGPCHTDERLRLVVIGGDVAVADRPVEPKTVGALRLEVVVGHPQRHAAVVIGPAAEHAGAKPGEVAAGCDGVGFTLELCAPKCRAVGKPSRLIEVALAFRSGSTMRHVVRPHVLFEIRQAQHRSGFEQQDGDAHIGKDVRDRAASGSRPDDHDVMNRVA